jgi:hydroxypyruvate reductase
MMRQTPEVIRDGLSIVQSGIRSVQADALIEQSETLELLAEDVQRSKRLFVVGAGKAAMAMASVLESALGERISDGTVVVPHGYVETLPDRFAAPRRIEVLQAGHPIPDARGVEAAGRALEIGVHCNERDLLLVLISGGTSALWAGYAPGISLEEAAVATELLLESGATIQEINVVRKHISSIAGGRLMEVAAPAAVRVLVISDVVGNDLSSIGSGPCTADATTFADALSILDRYKLDREVPDSVLLHLERGSEGALPDTPKPGSLHAENVVSHLIGTNETAVDAMVRAAVDAGYRVAHSLSDVTGEAQEMGRRIAAGAAALVPGTCLIWGGETTVTVRGEGVGGRNHELALSAALEMAHSGTEACVLSVGTDGVDGLTGAAGAWADRRTVGRAREMGIEASESLDDNDSGRFFSAIGQQIVTGPTHTNVMDVGIALRPT